MTRYPDGLPKPLRDDYAFTPTNRIRRTEMDSGRARQRVEFESVPTFVPVTFLFTHAEARLFEAWADQVAGADWWTMPLYSPMYYADEEVRFTESPSGPEPISTSHWRYTANLELRKKPQMDAGVVEIIPEYILMADIFDIAMNKQWPEAD